MRMMRKLTLLALLLCASPAWAANFGYNTETTFGTQSLGLGTIVLKGNTTSGLKYIASTGDVVDSLRVYANSQGGPGTPVPILIGLYAASGSNPGTRVLLDTVDIYGVDDWYGVPVTDGSGGFNLTDGVTYMIFIAYLADNNPQPYYDAASTGDGHYLDANAAPSSWPGGGSDISRKYSMVAVYHNDGADTCSVTHSLSAIDTTTSTIVAENAYTWTPGTLDSMVLIWDDDPDPTSPLGRAAVTSSMTNPDTLTATGLSNCTSYYLWWEHYPNGCSVDRSDSIIVQTTCITTRSLKLGS